MTSEARKIIAAARRLPETERQEVVAALAAETGGKKANRTKTLTNRPANGYNAHMPTTVLAPKPAASIGRKIDDRRKELGLSIASLASQVGINPVSVSRIVHGHHGVASKNVPRFAKALKMTADDLLAGF